MSSDSDDLLYETDDLRATLIKRDTIMESQADHRVYKRFNILYWVATSVGALAVVLMLTWILGYKNGFGLSDPNQEFYWHPMLMILGLIFMYAQSMLIYRNARHAKKKALKLTHAALHCIVFIITVLGLKAAFDSHNYSDPPKPNLYTLHSWLGLVAVILFTYQFISGFLTFLFPGAPNELRATLLPVHTYFGAAIFMLVIITAMMGLSEKAIWSVTDYSNGSGEGILVNIMGVIVALFGALVLYLVYDPAYKRVALAEDQINLPSTID